jgi:hypothetical protein
VIFFTLEGGDVSVARRGSPAPFRPRAEYSPRFAASKRFAAFAFKDLDEGSMACVAVPAKSVPLRRLSRASARLRRAMVRTVDMLISGLIYTFRHQAMESFAEA